MYDVGRITSKPHSVGGLEIQPVARATGQGGRWQRLLQGTSPVSVIIQGDSTEVFRLTPISQFTILRVTLFDNHT